MLLNATTHKNILLQVLKDIYSDTTIAPFLGFKGGTAAFLFYGLDRFSVDLDFDLLNKEKEVYVHERVKSIIEGYGKIKDAYKKHFTMLYVLSYDDESTNIKIEIGLRNFGSKFELKSYLGISMLVMSPEDMFANKLVAMCERIGKTNRDIYDVWFFLKHNWPVNEDIVKKRTGEGLNETMGKCVELLEKAGTRSILAGMGELLDQKQKAWVKNSLVQDTIFLLKARTLHLGA